MRADNKAFAKAVALRKTFIFALQKSMNMVSLLVAFGRQCFKTALGKAPKRYA